MSSRRDKSPNYIRDSPVRDRLTTELRLRREINDLSEVVRRLEQENIVLRREQGACQECSYNRAFYEKKIKTLELQLKDRNLQTYQTSAEKKSLTNVVNDLETQLYQEKREKAILGQQVEDLRAFSPDRIRYKRLENDYSGAIQKLEYESQEKKQLRVEYLRVKELLDAANASLNLREIEINKIKEEVFELRNENVALNRRLVDARYPSPQKRDVEKLDLRIALQEAERKKELADSELNVNRRILEENRKKIMDLSNELFEREREYKRKLNEIANFSPDRSAERRVKALNDALRDSESVLESYRKELFRKEQDIADLRAQLEERSRNNGQEISGQDNQEEVQHLDAPAKEPEQKTEVNAANHEALLADKELEIAQLNNKIALAEDESRNLARELEIARLQLDQSEKSNANLKTVLKQQEEVIEQNNSKLAELAAKVYLSQVITRANEQIKLYHD